MKRSGILLFLCFALNSLTAQITRDITGKASSHASGEQLAGATVSIYYHDHVSGLIANKEGKFSIPATTYCDSVKISMVGYHSLVYTLHQLMSLDFLDAQLEIAPSALAEVIVKPVTALEVIKRAVAKISVNQPSENFSNKGFYREIIKDRNNYFSVAEAVFSAWYSPADKEYKLKLEQGRSKEDVAYTRLFEDFHPGGGPQAVAGNSFITGRPAFLNLKELKNFNYKIDSMVQFDGRWLYKISFDQKPGVREALDKGYVLIDTEDDGIVRYDVINSPLGTPYIKSLIGTDKIFAELLKINIQRKGWKRRVDFSKVSSKWVMSYTATEYNLDYKQPKKELDLQLTIAIELAFTEMNRPVEKEITNGEEWKKKNIVANLPTAFDSAFWGNKSIISPTEEIKNIITAISKTNHDLPATGDLAGWQYLNRNFFVTYTHHDTITLIPVMKCNWEDDAAGGLLFQDADSDFTIECGLEMVKNSDPRNIPDRGFQQSGIMVRSTGDSSENHIFFALGTGGNPNPKIFFRRTVDGRSKTVVSKQETMTGRMRLQKKGTAVIAFYKSSRESDYKKIGEFNLSWLTGKLQVGLAVSAAFSGDGPKMQPDMKASFSGLKIVQN